MESNVPSIEEIQAAQPGLPTIETSDGEVVGFAIPEDVEQTPEFKLIMLEMQLDIYKRLVDAFITGDVEVERDDDGAVIRLTYPSYDGECRDAIDWTT